MTKEERRLKFMKEHPNYLVEKRRRKLEEQFCKFCEMRLKGYHREIPCVESVLEIRKINNNLI